MLATLLTQYDLSGAIVPNTVVPFVDTERLEYGHAIFADHLPRGRLWDACRVRGTPDYALTSAVGAMYVAVLDYLEYVRRETNPYTTVDLITDWETSVGLPDPCTVGRDLTLQQRRDLVNLRLGNTPIVTTSQMQDLVLLLTGYAAIVMPRTNPLNPNFEAGKRFYIDVFVDYEDVSGFDGGGEFDGGAEFDGQPYPTIVECVLNRVKPATSILNVYYSRVLYLEAGGV